MGALKGDEQMSASADLQWPRNIPRMAPLVSPESSFSSSASFGDKVSRSQSPARLRRSTLDLGHIKSSGVLALSEPELQDTLKDQREILTLDFVSQEADAAAAMRYLAVLQAIVIAESGIRRLINDARHHVKNVFGFFLNAIFHTNEHTELDDACLSGRQRCNDSRERLDEPPPDPPLSPARVTEAPNANPRDEWGHFADFQDEIVDEQSFIPSFSCIQKSLETLEESDGDENDEDAFSF
jgi:hypothetical protein